MNTLPQILDFAHAQSLRDMVMALLPTGALTLDASAVDRMSTPCVQLLLATGRAAGSAATSFRITHASAAFRMAVADLGLEADFSMWMD